MVRKEKKALRSGNGARMPKAGGYRKGQAMMEYLMTYGLALFIIVVVIGILVAVVLPMLNPPDSCNFTQPGFSCKKVMVADKTSGNTEIIFQINNEAGRGVSLYKVLCTEAPVGNVQSTMMTVGTYTWAASDQTNGYPIAAGGSKSYGSAQSDQTQKITCLKQDNTPVTLAVNSNFKGTLAVEFKYDDDVAGAPHRIATATVTGSVIQGTQ